MLIARNQLIPELIGGGNRINIATNCQHPTSDNLTNSLSNGTDTGGTFRSQHIVAYDSTDISFVFGNYYDQDAAGPNDITINCAFEPVLGSGRYPLTFGGKNSVTINPFGIVQSDPIAVKLSAGQAIYLLENVSVSAGGKWVQGTLIRSSTFNEGYTSGSDLTAAGSPSTTGLPRWGFGPQAILGTVNPPASPSILIVGDSIAKGATDTDSNNDNAKGYVARALNNVPIPWIKIARYNENMYNQFILGSGGVVGCWRRLTFAQYCTHAIVESGHNDINQNQTLAQIQTSLQTIWGWLVLRGLKVYQSTITPRTTSTDSWATTNNQTIVGHFGPNDVRTQLNDWIRTVPSPLTGYMEAADLAETSRNSGIWKPGYTVDGIHCNSTGSAAVAKCINPYTFTIS